MMQNEISDFVLTKKLDAVSEVITPMRVTALLHYL
jgi:hypothetical protein